MISRGFGRSASVFPGGTNNKSQGGLSDQKLPQNIVQDATVPVVFHLI